jgi:hypothetical protein
LWAALALSSLSTTGRAEEILGGLPRGLHHLADKSKQVLFETKKPNLQKEPSVEALAKQIDWLENHIACYGTIVPKQPDVWGEARLTRHRDDMEVQLRTLFQSAAAKDTLQARISRSDLAMLSLAFALGAGAPAPTITTSADSSSTTAEKAPPPTAQASITLQQPITPPKTTPATADKIALEPTIVADQVYRYLSHVNELLRLNEGDVESDSPGYSLSLVRIPFSVLAG